MKLYTDDGYLNIEAILATKLPYILCVGGRAIGKTYGALEYVIDHEVPFIFMRRTQSQCDIISRDEFSPFRSLMTDREDLFITARSITKYNAGFYKGELQDGKIVPTGAPIGYTMALSTVSNLRGFDASQVKLLIYDEFIPEKHERPLKNEGAAFLNAIETIGRNRELKGEDPLQVLCLANANDLGNPVFKELKIISKVEKMMRKGQSYSLDYQRGIGIFLLKDSPISKRKAKTALYLLSGEGEFSEMSLSNDFADLKHGSVKPQPIKEYVPIVTLGEITFYKHKSNGRYYCTTMRVGSPEVYEPNDTDIRRFMLKYNWIYRAYMQDLILFEDTTAEIIYNQYIS